ncbi:MAG: hypothetical protein JWL77_6946 [Chthonomonadaceae bacterium]|nr:hypothetical protein [Chthonomonadaceae bacterium]
MKLRGMLFTITAFVLSGCAAGVSEHGTSLAAATATPTYSCAFYAEFDSLSACQTSTQANCNSEWKTFPSGGVGLCYLPVTGFETCAVSVPTWDWVYTAYSSWCYTGVVGVYREDRSLIGCSSTICNCATTPVLSKTCTNTVDCPGAGSILPTPTPVPLCP